jgi:hypothetical protein
VKAQLDLNGTGARTAWRYGCSWRMNFPWCHDRTDDADGLRKQSEDPSVCGDMPFLQPSVRIGDMSDVHRSNIESDACIFELIKAQMWESTGEYACAQNIDFAHFSFDARGEHNPSPMARCVACTDCPNPPTKISSHTT